MKLKNVRVVIPVVILLLALVGYAVGAEFGTLSAAGFGELSLLCPLGSLTTLIASKIFVPRALVSLVVAFVLIAVFGRAFCGWVCPIPLVSRLRGLFGRKRKASKEPKGVGGETVLTEPLSDEEKKILFACSGARVGSCSSCGGKRSAVDSRHVVLGGAVLSAAVFGFPVFCLVCPIGLTFATLFLVFNLFAHGDTTWAVLVAPAILLIEVVFFRKWCAKICPLSALMSLVAKANRTFRPAVNKEACLESKGASCGACANACEQGIDPRHPERGASWSECTKCRECVEACPASAIRMPLFLPKDERETVSQHLIDHDRFGKSS